MNMNMIRLKMQIKILVATSPTGGKTYSGGCKCNRKRLRKKEYL
ncbi:hypothetical protein GQ55_8G203300 [Panicum hallii var. hallii]|uniref:Uncharacterized protein n=1 Tax=Panicum hallii var. hallii TaxID=1504633 RepID=A0A2T7CPF2_9POAL|nr:hypothetical protein GQ55_8G203300 [Panicum hallii var. hallii]